MSYISANNIKKDAVHSIFIERILLNKQNSVLKSSRQAIIDKYKGKGDVWKTPKKR